MKFWAKINRGLVLTTAVLLVVVAYLIVLQFSHDAARPEIESVCKNYIKTAVNYTMLPEKYRKDNSVIPQGELDSYLTDMENDIRAFYPDDEQTYKYVIGQYKLSLENQAKGLNKVYSYTKEISSFKNLKFDGSTVTASIITNSNYNGPAFNTNINYGASVIKGGTGGATTSSGQTTDTIVLRKTGGEWKAIYAYLQQPSTGASPIS